MITLNISSDFFFPSHQKEGRTENLVVLVKVETFLQFSLLISTVKEFTFQNYYSCHLFSFVRVLDYIRTINCK